jgi:hypothetical protein
MSGSREAALLSERDQLRKELAELREAEPVQEPVAWLSYGDVSTKRSDFGHAQVTPLYAAPDGLRKAAQTALYLLKENLIAFGPCDHDVGICNCDIEQCIDLLRKELGQ